MNLFKGSHPQAPLRVAFSDFYGGFDVHQNLFTDVLRQIYDVEIVDRDPDLMFCSTYGAKSVEHQGRKVLVIFENFRAALDAYDAVISFDYTSHPRHFRLPLAMMGPAIQRPSDWSAEAELASKSRFCNFIYSNPSCGIRNELLRQLSRYKRVDCGGRCFNNMGGRVGNKLELQRQCKFSIAFENSTHPGYLTEKLSQALMADTIPLYWGDPFANLDFNPLAFLHQDDFASVEALVERVVELDQDDDQYLAILSQPRYHEGQKPERFSHENLLAFLHSAIESEEPPIASEPGYGKAAAAHAARVKSDIWQRRLKRWMYRCQHLIPGSGPRHRAAA